MDDIIHQPACSDGALEALHSATISQKSRFIEFTLFIFFNAFCGP